jgi:MoaA/NifB/PqqE/SkfB family radical SAM enzyme
LGKQAMSSTDGGRDGREPVWPWRKRAQLLRSYCAGRPVWCAWQVTYRCNFRCHFCQYWRGAAEAAGELTVEEFARGARKLARWGATLISLGGGEPLLRPDIVEIVRELARYHFVFLTTNGWLATPELARRLYEAGLWGASVSLDYADPVLHDRQRGRDGAFERARAALSTFVAARTQPYQRVNLLATLVADNLGEMEGLAALALEVGANFMVQPYSALKTGRAEFLPQPAVSRQLLALHDRYPNFLSHRRFLARFDAAVNGGVPRCRAGRNFFNVDECGQVALCVERRAEAVGDLVRDDLSALGNRLRRAARDNRCQACWYNCRGEVEALYDVRGFLDALSTYLLGPRAEMALRGAAGGGRCSAAG